MAHIYVEGWAPEYGSSYQSDESLTDDDRVDTDVEVPAAYVYAVLALDADGEIIGRSRVVEAVLHERDRRIEPLHLGCNGHRTETDRAALDAAVPDLAVWVTCEWRPATRSVSTRE